MSKALDYTGQVVLMPEKLCAISGMLREQVCPREMGRRGTFDHLGPLYPPLIFPLPPSSGCIPGPGVGVGARLPAPSTVPLV